MGEVVMRGFFKTKTRRIFSVSDHERRSHDQNREKNIGFGHEISVDEQNLSKKLVFNLF
jgi:hypothetical protein